MKKPSARHVLLTGAGFTKNFGGLLANEMWSKIFNNPKAHAHPRLKDLLLHDFDYESIYHQVISGDYTDQEKDSINELIFEAYQALDSICREWTFRNGAPYPVNIYGVNKFLEQFSGTRDEIGFVFTLNQDLFIERTFKSVEGMLIHPGMRNIPNADKISSRLPLELSDFVRVPTIDEFREKPVNKITAGKTLNFVKLHGSFGWLTSTGTNCYVIGQRKEERIAGEPLLAWYFKLFTEVLSKSDKKLLVIGYGFRDPHVNNAIASAIMNSGLQLFVISPSDNSAFIGHLRAIEQGETILHGLTRYFPYKLLDIFPSDQSESHAWREIVDCYFRD